MASEADKRELVTKIQALVNSKFNRSFREAFDHYARGNGASVIDGDKLETLLKDAEVGNAFTRGRWVSGIMTELDKDRSGFISWQEFSDVISAQ